jgi:predicted enzyme related to lactoylglutathione lyase
VSYESRTGAVLFASRLDQVAAFYAHVLGLREANRDDDHILLESPGFQLVVHRIPGHSTTTIDVAEPTVRRAGAAFKPVFFVHNLASVRTVASAHGGTLEPQEMEGHSTVSWFAMAVDPEGNVIQLRENRAEGMEGGGDGGDGGNGLTTEERSNGGKRRRNAFTRHFDGTRRFSSSNQCCTTIRLAGAGVSPVPSSLIMRNHCPSDAMSYVRPGFGGIVKYPSLTTMVGFVAAHNGPLSTPTRMMAPVGET